MPGSPIDLTTFAAEITQYKTDLAAAQDGGKKAIAQKNKSRGVVEKSLSKLATFVQETANNDATIITAAGFQPVTGKTTSQPMATPVIGDLLPGPSGQMKLKMAPVFGARLYYIQWGAQGAGGTLPTSWSTLMVAKAQPPTVITGLTPGTTYVFQVKAFGTLGFTEFSNPMSKMAL